MFAIDFLIVTVCMSFYISVEWPGVAGREGMCWGLCGRALFWSWGLWAVL